MKLNKSFSSRYGRQTVMTKTVAFFTVAGMVTIPETRRLQHPGQGVWPSWNSFGRRSVILSMDSAGFFQDLLQHVCIKIQLILL